MNKLVFVVFDDDGGGFNAVEGNYSLMVVGRNMATLKREIRNVVLDYFGPNFKGNIIVRKFNDEVLRV